MSKNIYLKSTANINYLDYSEFMGTSCGIVIKNDLLVKESAPEFIAGNILGISENNITPITLNQKHTNVIVTPGDDLKQPADGVYTDKNDYVLIIRTADCFPVMLYDGNILAAIHAGWRSVFTGILKEFFTEVKEFDIANAKAVVSPGIRECCFEVSPDVFILFDSKYRVKNDKGCFIDLKSLILDELKAYGVNSILDNTVCTSCNNDKYYSYRREGSNVKQMFSYIYKGASR